jgi:hypothetical protein
MRVISSLLSLLFVVFIAAYAEADLVGFWPFDEGQGSVARDMSGNGNDGTINNATWTAGRFGRALELNGIDANVEVEHSSVLSVEEFTLMAWVNVPGFIGAWQTIATQNTDGPTRNYGLFINDVSGLVHYSFTSGNAWQSFNATSNIVDGQWHHIAATYDKAAFKCYVDGVVDGETPVDLTPDNADTVITIGSWVDGGWLKGTIDEVALYNNALSEAEINAAMNGLIAPVDGKDKLTTCWGSLKATH